MAVSKTFALFLLLALALTGKHFCSSMVIVGLNSLNSSTHILYWLVHSRAHRNRCSGSYVGRTYIILVAVLCNFI